ncbi:MAG TPA: glycosyltransferase family 4 protein [Bryobacteraceae bacterium]|jgi:glycosyltransferase involved in cell wall biosynthesis
MSAKGMRRILLTGDTEGGVWTFTLELAGGLLTRGADVCLATFGPAVTESQKWEASKIAGLRWFHHHSKLEWMHEPWADIECAGHWLEKVAAQWQPDLIHLNTLCHGALTWNVPVVITHHSSVTSWWHDVKRCPLPADWRHYQREVEHSLRSATIISAPSRSELAAIARDYDIDMAGARAVHNGLSSGVYQVGEKEELILSAGRLWDEGKNVRALAEVAPRLPWPVYLAGDSRTSDGAAPALIGCHLLGKLNRAELSVLYSRAAIYALPARYEPFGLSILEAALSGCALLLGDIPSLREIWQDAAMFVSPDDSSSLEAGLCHLIADPIHRARMSQLAYCRACEFSQSRMVDGYLSLYQSALAKYEKGLRRQACAS